MANTPPARYPELDRLASRLAKIVLQMINAEARAVQSEMKYKAQYILEALVEELQTRV